MKSVCSTPSPQTVHRHPTPDIEYATVIFTKPVFNRTMALKWFRVGGREPMKTYCTLLWTGRPQATCDKNYNVHHSLSVMQWSMLIVEWERAAMLSLFECQLRKTSVNTLYDVRVCCTMYTIVRLTNGKHVPSVRWCDEQPKHARVTAHIRRVINDILFTLGEI